MISVAKGRGDIGENAHVMRGMAPPQSSHSSGSLDAGRQALVRSHLPLVRAMARRYAGRGEEFDDLVQAGSVGLVKAAGRFDPSRGVAFATFVAPAVEGEIRRHLRERTPGVRLPRAMQRMSAELQRTRGELAAALGRSPEISELAAALDADVCEVERLIAADLVRHPVALGAGDADVERPGELEPLAESEYRVLLASGLRALGDRERRIIFLRFHADMTERQIARAIGISQAHVSRLLDGALTKLRAEFHSADSATDADITKSGVVSHGKAPETAETEAKIVHVGARKESVRAQSGKVAHEGSGSSPKTKASPSHSGRFLVRMPSELHEQLALAAERREVSLNRYVTDTLSSSVGLASSDHTDSPPGSPGAPGPAKGSDRLRPRTLRMALVTNLVVVVLAGMIAVVLMVLALQRGI